MIETLINTNDVILTIPYSREKKLHDSVCKKQTVYASCCLSECRGERTRHVSKHVSC